MLHVRFACCLGLLLAAIGAPARAAEESGNELFEKKIRPVLVEKCYSCHSAQAKAVKGGLLLDTREGTLAGGESGPAVIPGKVDESLLIQAIAYSGEFYDMPPAGKLPENVIADFRKWIELGAPDPRGGSVTVATAKPAGIDLEQGRKFWAFVPPKLAPLPQIKNTAWPRADLDRFVLARLEAQGLSPVGDIDRVMLLRRLTFDLIGLPPTPEEIDAFVADPSPDALPQVVDRLLMSPHFGERWGRHWLDVARFAESSGGGRSMVFKEAWRYRDYAINAFNADKPFNRFVTEQVAGDLLAYDNGEQREQQLIATAFLMLGPINYEEQDKSALEMDVADEQIDTLGRAFMGMTIGCARCHDHKFDPIPTSDYYALAGIFRSSNMLIHDNVSRWTEAALPMEPEKENACKQHELVVAELTEQIKLAKREAAKAGKAIASTGSGPAKSADFPGVVIDDAQAKRVGDWTLSQHNKQYIGDGYLHDNNEQKGEKTLTFAPKLPQAGMYEVRLAYTPGTNRCERVPVEILHLDGEFNGFVNEREDPPVDGRFVSLGKFRFDTSDRWFVMVSNADTAGHVIVDAVQFIPEAATADDAAGANTANAADVPVAKSAAVEATQRLASLEKQLKALEKKAPPRPLAMAITESDKVEDCQICIRGNVHSRGDRVPRGFLQVALPGPMPQLPSNESGRRELAAWLASEANPLTARVMVNRVWHHLLGVGIVRTVDNFGSTGELPSHPELLDYLATRFMQDGWSVKRLIREIVLSRTYQLSTETNGKLLAADPENRLLSHANRRRLDAEALRDAMLAASGALDGTMSGPTIVHDNEKGLTPDGEYGYVFEGTRRSVYTPVFRNRLLELFEVFDFADPNNSLGRRNVSTVAPQALFLLNSPFVTAQARLAAEQSIARDDLNDSQRIERAFRASLGRMPTAHEREISLNAIQAAGQDNPEARLAAWERLHQALFACIDFRYLD